MHATTHFKPLDSSIMASIGMGGSRRSVSAENDQPRSSSNNNSNSTMMGATTSNSNSDPSRLKKNDEFFYRCPLFKSRMRFETLQEPIAYIYMPTDQAAGLMTVHGAALFLSNDE